METLQHMIGLTPKETTHAPREMGGKEMLEEKRMEVVGGPVPSIEELKAKEVDYQKVRQQIPHTDAPLACTPEYYVKFQDKVMLACQWESSKTMSMAHRLVRAVTDPGDAIIRVTSTTICGSDLHMFYNALPDSSAMLKGDILGHECMGVVDEVGPGVKHLKIGDRVVVAAIISCGNCQFCVSKRPSLCDRTNPSKRMEEQYGHRLAGVLGYSHLTGGYSGGQAEYVRVPLADHNCLKVPNNLKDEQVLLLSDVCCTGFHCNEMGSVGEGDVVAVWGLGPIGLMACYLAKTLRKAKRVIGIECLEFRLEAARKLGIEVINFETHDVYETLMEMTNKQGPDVCIEAAGFRYTKSLSQKVQTLIGLDSSDIPSEMIKCCSKGGRLSLIGDYFGLSNAFPIGAMMEKSLTVRGGQVFVQTYWQYLLNQIEKGAIDISFMFTHQRKFEECDAAYQQFADRVGNCYKIQLLTQFGLSQRGHGSVAAGGHGGTMSPKEDIKIQETAK